MIFLDFLTSSGFKRSIDIIKIEIARNSLYPVVGTAERENCFINIIDRNIYIYMLLSTFG